MKSSTIVKLLILFTFRSSVSGKSLFVGFDIGTSGVRISIIDRSLQEVYAQAIAWDKYDDPASWMRSTTQLFQDAGTSVNLQHVSAKCFSGTSASCLLVDSKTLQ